MVRILQSVAAMCGFLQQPGTKPVGYVGSLGIVLCKVALFCAIMMGITKIPVFGPLFPALCWMIVPCMVLAGFSALAFSYEHQNRAFCIVTGVLLLAIMASMIPFYETWAIFGGMVGEARDTMIAAAWKSEFSSAAYGFWYTLACIVGLVAVCHREAWIAKQKELALAKAASVEAN